MQYAHVSAVFQRFVHLCEIGVFLAGLASLAGFAGEWHWLADLAAHFRVQYFLCGILCAVVLFLSKNWRWGIMGMVVAGLNAASLVQTFLPEKAPITQKDARLQVVSFNLFTGNSNRQEVIDWLAASEADVLILMETNHAWWEVIQDLRGQYPHRAADIREDNFGMAILSRIPWESLDWMNLPLQLPGLHVRFRLEGEHEMHLFGIHPPPPIGAFRSGMRDKTLDDLSEKIRAIYAPVLLLGDLNTTPWASSFQRFEKSSGMKRHSGGFRPTWHAFGGLAGIPIDHALTTNGAQIHKHDNGPRMGSDHSAQILEVGIPQSQ